MIRTGRIFASLPILATADILQEVATHIARAGFAVAGFRRRP